MKLAAAGNVMVPAILLLEERGFSVSVDRSGASELWLAHQGDVDLVADDPLELLGLAALWQARGVSWQATDAEIDSTMARFRLL